MNNALYLKSSEWDTEISLTGQQANHIHSLRMRVGESVLLLDGEGAIGQCVIENIRKRNVIIKVIDRKIISPPRCQPIMAIAISKAVRRGFFLEKASELGAWAIWLWQAERSMGKISDELVEHCRGKLIAGCEQSQNPWLPRLKTFKNAHELCLAAKDVNIRLIPWEEQNPSTLISLDQLGKDGTTIFAIGPEGGYTRTEMDIFKAADFNTVSLGKRVLRCETAATLCLGLQWWASQRPNGSDGN